MNDLEQFLRRASRGLWGRERQTVRRELESHIQHRANRYEVSGSSHNDAIKLAIADLGAPREISAGMRSAYTVPNTIRVGVMASALSVLALMGMQFGKAHVVGTTRYPTPACLESNRENFRAGPRTFFPCEDGLNINLVHLQNLLEPLGVSFGPSAIKNATAVRFPGGKPIRLIEWSDMYLQEDDGAVFLTPIVKGYISLWEFWAALRETQLPITIEGFEQPKIRVGRTAFSLPSSPATVKGLSTTWMPLSKELEAYFFGQDNDVAYLTGDLSRFGREVIEPTQRFGREVIEPTQRFEYTIRTNLEPGSIVVVLSRELVTWRRERPTPEKIRRACLIPVAADGTIRYTSFSRDLSIGSIGGVQRGLNDGRATVALARFTGQLGLRATALEAIAPESIEIESR
jgi:hypothetical protein